MPTTQDIITAVYAVGSKDELKNIQSAISIRWSELTTKAARAFRPGDRVTWQTKQGVPMSGRVTRINRKTIGIQADDGDNWRVAPSLLSPE
jgi:hypothetical protein